MEKTGNFDFRSSNLTIWQWLGIKENFKAELFTLGTRNLVETTPLSKPNLPLGSIKKMDFTTN